MMGYTLLLHVANQEPVKADVEELPKPGDNCILVRNPRTRDDKEVRGLDEGVTQVLYPWWRINYIQILPSAEQEEEFPLLFRER
jgi:hypothetical protein